MASLVPTCKAAQTRVRVWDPACADQEADLGTPLEWCQTEIGRAMPPHTTAASLQKTIPNNLSSDSSFAKRTRHLRRIIAAPDQLYTRACWRDWFDHSMTLSLESNLEDVQRQIGPTSAIIARRLLTNTPKQWRRVRRKFQSWVHSALHQKSAPDAHRRFASKLSRWNLHSPTQPLHDHLSVMQRTSNWQARCARQRLKTLAKPITPRVHATMFGAI